MTENQMYDAISQGKLIGCDEEDYPQTRSVIQKVAGRFIDEGQLLKGVIALREVERLDEKFDFQIT